MSRTCHTQVVLRRSGYGKTIMQMGAVVGIAKRCERPLVGHRLGMVGEGLPELVVPGHHPHQTKSVSSQTERPRSQHAATATAKTYR
jgi:hypothetical protein